MKIAKPALLLALTTALTLATYADADGRGMQGMVPAQPGLSSSTADVGQNMQDMKGMQDMVPGQPGRHAEGKQAEDMKKTHAMAGMQGMAGMHDKRQVHRGHKKQDAQDPHQH